MDAEPGPQPLEGLKVVDAATLFAGPLIGCIMGDWGADVIKVEHPRGDDLRRLGWQKDGVSLWWALVARNKRCVTLNLSAPRGQELMRTLLSDADVLIENFRPGTLERWNLGPDALHELNPGLVIVRVTGFGQTGPYRRLPGFGTLAEAMSGFAHLNGWPHSPPTLPPSALGDGVAALSGTYATMFALWWREHGGNGRGQVIDLSIFEPLFWLLGPQALVYDQLGTVQERTGNRLPFAAPRNLYRAKDGRWLALSATSQSVAERVMVIVGRPDFIAEEWFKDHEGRLAHADELDAIIQEWIGARSSYDVIEIFAANEAAIAPVYSIADIFEDEHYRAREALMTVAHPTLGPMKMQNVMPRLTQSPGRIRYPGPELGEHNIEVFVEELGCSQEDLDRLSQEGVI